MTVQDFKMSVIARNNLEWMVIARNNLQCGGHCWLLENPTVPVGTQQCGGHCRLLRAITYSARAAVIARAPGYCAHCHSARTVEQCGQ